MGTQIQALPDPVIAAIAAGEVIDSWAAVVRELAENALDAGASRISLDLWPQRWQLRLADNGWGMELPDLRQAALAHHTSKIETAADLWNIVSLGFRGEALHSLCQGAEVDICSRPAQATAGWRIRYDRQGQPRDEQTVAIAPGTIVTVSDLFATWPGRRRALPPLPQQLQAVQQTLQRLALCHPQVTWQARLDDRPWVTIWPAASPRQVLPQMLRQVHPQDLRETEQVLPLPGNEGPPRVYLLLGLPDRCHRRRNDWVRVAVNGRPVILPELEQAMVQAFRRTLPGHRYPICFAHLRVDPSQLDWNRHPAKAILYLQQLEEWCRALPELIDQTLQADAIALGDSSYQPRLHQMLKTAEASGTYAAASAPKQPGALRAVAQVHNRYILAEHAAGLCLIEQHIAHERVLYEQLCDHWQVVPLASPILLEHLSEAQVEQLRRLQLTVDAFGPALWAVRSAPAQLAQRDDCPEALQELSLGGDLEAAIVATACRTAIRNGTPLDLATMRSLLDQWQQTRHPHTCPHGRPICLTLQESSLARFFRRHWVIGKSHGLER